MGHGSSHDIPRENGPSVPQNSPTASRRGKSEGPEIEDIRKDGWPAGMRQRGGAFYFERKIDGVRHKFSLPFTEAKAIKRATAANELLAEGRSIEHLKSGQRVTLARFIEQMREDSRAKRSATRKSLRARLRILSRFLSLRYPGLTRLSAFSGDVAERFIDWRAKTPVSRNGSPNSKGEKLVPSQPTLAEDLRIMRSFFERAVALKWIAENPFVRIKAPTQPRRRFEPYSLSEAEIVRLIQAAIDYDAQPKRRGSQSTYRGFMTDMTRLFLFTGLRAKSTLCCTKSCRRYSTSVQR